MRFARLNLWFKLLAFLLFYVGTVTLVVPTFLLWWADGRWSLGLRQVRYVGLLPLIGGIVLYLLCSIQLVVRGKGTPAPLEATSRLIESGPYAMVRNPMYLAAALFFLGQAILMDSGILLIYSSLMIFAYHLGVIWLEEPALARRFGARYAAYCARVPRWLPWGWTARE
jgi:protein-S-isoprenylcysteine O-methyltransferase Ste14